MKTIKMCYRGFEFPVNVKSINAELSKRISRSPIIRKGTRLQEICFNPIKLSGEGCFFGKDAENNARALMTVFKDKGSAYLFSPVNEPMKMFFSDLKISADSERECINYSFTFIEDGKNKSRRRDIDYIYAKRNDNLYDIANRHGISFERIFLLNSFKDMFSVEEGDKVWLK